MGVGYQCLSAAAFTAEGIPGGTSEPVPKGLLKM